MAAAGAVRKPSALKVGQHTPASNGRCAACSPSICLICEQRTLHNVGSGYGIEREGFCENGCSTGRNLELRWRAEMKEALYQFERREARKRRRH